MSSKWVLDMKNDTTKLHKSCIIRLHASYVLFIIKGEVCYINFFYKLLQTFNDSKKNLIYCQRIHQ